MESYVRAHDNRYPDQMAFNNVPQVTPSHWAVTIAINKNFHSWLSNYLSACIAFLSLLRDQYDNHYANLPCSPCSPMTMLVSLVADFDSRDFTTRWREQICHANKRNWWKYGLINILITLKLNKNTIDIWITHICLYGISRNLANVLGIWKSLLPPK